MEQGITFIQKHTWYNIFPVKRRLILLLMNINKDMRRSTVNLIGEVFLFSELYKSLNPTIGQTKMYN